jgi:hypothetical protein
MPVGFKNGTDGGIQVAVNACLAAAGPHSFLGISDTGYSAVVTTTGNPSSFVILRGGRHGPNYQEEYVVQAARLMREAHLRPAVMIDCSHANAEGDFRRQETVWYKMIEQIVAQPTPIIGMMVESNIVDFSRWLQATMGERPDVLPASTLRLAQAPRVNTARIYGGELRQANSDAHYGLGWRTFTYDGRQFIGHSGAVDGYRATLIFEPATRTGVVAMWNSNWGTPFRIPFAVFDSYHQRTESRWLELDD